MTYNVTNPQGCTPSGCPRTLVPLVGSSPPLVRTPLCPHMHLQIPGSPSYPLGGVHDVLRKRVCAAGRMVPGNTNVVAVAFTATFDVRVPDRLHRSVTVTFSFRIPRRDCFHYGRLRFPLHAEQLLKEFYQKGRSLANPRGCTHGPRPAYAEQKPGHAQFIRHTEQVLLVYLAQRGVLLQILARACGELRSRIPYTMWATLQHLGIHLHSGRTCCPPCEYTLLGATQPTTQAEYGLYTDLFSRIREAVAALRKSFLKEVVRLTLAGGFTMRATVGATRPDNSHRIVPVYSGSLSRLPPLLLDTTTPPSSIPTAYVDTPSEPLVSPDLEDTTVFFSGTTTPGSFTKALKAYRQRTARNLFSRTPSPTVPG